MVHLEEKLVDFLRLNVTDPHSTRTGQWIYPHTPEYGDVVEWPVMAVTATRSSSTSIGGTNDMWGPIEFEMEIVTFRNDLRGGKENQYQVDSIGADVLNQLRTKWKDELIPQGLHNFTVIDSRPLDYDPIKNTYRRLVQVRFDAFNANE